MGKLVGTECIRVAKESGDGISYVAAEPSTARGELISFDLTPGATIDDAYEVARFMLADSGVRFSWGIAG
jgi:hypothetical protein